MANIDELLDGICATVYELEEPIKKIVEERSGNIYLILRGQGAGQDAEAFLPLHVHHIARLHTEEGRP